MKLSLVTKDGTPRGGGTIRLAIAKAGMRGEVDLQPDRGIGLHRVVLCKADTPNINYLLSDADRTYSEVHLSPPIQAGSSSLEQPAWTVKRLGRQKFLGYKTQHVLAKPKSGAVLSMELWIATDLLDFDTFRKLQAGSGGATGGEGALAQALKAAGAEGMPLKVLVTTQDGDTLRLEVVKAEKKSLPPSTFQIPPGYTRAGP